MNKPLALALIVQEFKRREQFRTAHNLIKTADHTLNAVELAQFHNYLDTI